MSSRSFDVPTPHTRLGRIIDELDNSFLTNSSPTPAAIHPRLKADQSRLCYEDRASSHATEIFKHKIFRKILFRVQHPDTLHQSNIVYYGSSLMERFRQLAVVAVLMAIGSGPITAGA